jgi:hypothetical protein
MYILVNKISVPPGKLIHMDFAMKKHKSVSPYIMKLLQQRFQQDQQQTDSLHSICPLLRLLYQLLGGIALAEYISHFFLN